MGSITEQEEDIPSYASSLPVPNVQEMVIKDPLQVSERYIRNEQEMQNKLNMSHLSSEVPVIDLSLLSKGNKEELMKLDLACKEWGFFQVIYIYIWTSLCTNTHTYVWCYFPCI